MKALKRIKTIEFLCKMNYIMIQNPFILKYYRRVKNRVTRVILQMRNTVRMFQNLPKVLKLMICMKRLMIFGNVKFVRRQRIKNVASKDILKVT